MSVESSFGASFKRGMTALKSFMKPNEPRYGSETTTTSERLSPAATMDADEEVAPMPMFTGSCEERVDQLEDYVDEQRGLDRVDEVCTQLEDFGRTLESVLAEEDPNGPLHAMYRGWTNQQILQFHHAVMRLHTDAQVIFPESP